MAHIAYKTSHRWQDGYLGVTALPYYQLDKIVMHSHAESHKLAVEAEANRRHALAAGGGTMGGLHRQQSLERHSVLDYIALASELGE